MKAYKFVFVCVLMLLLASEIECKKKKKDKRRSNNESIIPSTKTETKTKWSSTTDNGPNGSSSLVASEEHGYYIKRTFMPANGVASKVANTLQGPPYLGIPIAWFSCEGQASCLQTNTGAIAGSSNALSEGFLCDDDCAAPYEPVCGRTPSEVAVFYNKCKLNVAKCRTHGLWTELAYDECKQTYTAEVAYADKKFRASPFFNEKLLNMTDAAQKEQKLTAVAEMLQEVISSDNSSSWSSSSEAGEVVPQAENETNDKDINNYMETATIFNEPIQTTAKKNTKY